MATHRRRSLLGPVLAAMLIAASCSSSGSEPGATRPSADVRFPVTLTDDNGVRVTLQSPPKRIVTFAPSMTEILFALGLGDRVVGVSGPSDDYPPAARKIEGIGAGEFGTEPNVEKVVSLHADLFLYAFTGEAPWMDKLRSLGVPVFTSLASDFADLLRDIEHLGQLTGAEEAAIKLVARMRTGEGPIERSATSGPPVTCFFEVGYGPPIYTVGPGSFIYDLLQRAGCDPVTAAAKTDYPQWSVEALLRDDPTVYLVDSESGGTVASVGKRPGYHALSSVRGGLVYLVDGDLVARPGPRVVDGLSQMARLLHPEAFG